MSMAYQVVPDFAFGYNRTTRIWEKVNVATPVQQLLATYHLMEIGVSAMGVEYTFHPHYHLAELAGASDTLQAWLDSKAGYVIADLAPGYPSLQYGHMHFQSLYADFRAKAHLCPPGFHYSQDFSMDDAYDIVLEVPPEAQATYVTGALYLIDGQPVTHVQDGVGVRLRNAGKIAMRAGKSNVSMLVFKDIGDVTTHPMSELTLEKLDVSRDWYSTLLLRTPKGLTGRTAAVCIAGTLFWITPRDYINETTLRLSLPNYRVTDAILGTRKYYDWDELGIGDLSHPTLVSALRNPETFHQLLLHSSSFLVLIDNPYLEHEIVSVERAAAPGTYYLRQPGDPDGLLPLGPLVAHDGRMLNYWPTFEDGRWTMESLSFPTERTVFNEARWHRQTRINDAQTCTGDDWVDPHPHMLRIRARKK